MKIITILWREWHSHEYLIIFYCLYLFLHKVVEVGHEFL